jgi:hypothetical protein
MREARKGSNGIYDLREPKRSSDSTQLKGQTENEAKNNAMSPKLGLIASTPSKKATR